MKYMGDTDTMNPHRIGFENWARQQPYFGYENTAGKKADGAMFGRDRAEYVDGCIHSFSLDGLVWACS